MINPSICGGVYFFEQPKAASTLFFSFACEAGFFVVCPVFTADAAVSKFFLWCWLDVRGAIGLYSLG